LEGNRWSAAAIKFSRAFSAGVLTRMAVVERVSRRNLGAAERRGSGRESGAGATTNNLPDILIGGIG
jgi:hypothetical protein